MPSAPKLFARDDRLKPWLSGEIKDFIFDEFSPSFIEKSGLAFLKGVSMPLKAADLAAFHKEEGLGITVLADNMAMVIGADPNFKFARPYLQYLALYFNEKLITVFNQTAGAHLQEKRYKKAAIYYRAALMLDENDKTAMFGYACCCREWYLSLEGEDEQQLIAVLKDESQEYFELLCSVYPDFAAPCYFLGYAYLNKGQYKKTEIIWKRFLAAAGEKDREAVLEVSERMESLKDPVNIEEGVNRLMAGDIKGGLSILEPYTKTDYNNWWPLHFYLACAYDELGYVDEAIEGYKKVIALSPSDIASTEALARLYASKGQADMADKYLKKTEVLKSNRS